MDSCLCNECTPNRKAIVLNKVVVVGRGCKTTIDNATLTGPTVGYTIRLGLSTSPQLSDFPTELMPPFTAYQVRENIHHPARHDFQTGIIEGEWHVTDVPVREGTLPKQT